MADFSIIWRIAADITGLQADMKRAANSAEGLEDNFNRIGKAIAGALTVGAIVRFGQAIIDDADALVKLHDKTQISIAGLQRFQVVGDDAGNSIEQITGAINKMQLALANGDQGAISAIRALGLNFAEFKALKPEDQFIQISEKIRGIHDPLDRAKILSELFGRSWSEILPTLLAGFDDVKDKVVGMSEEGVRGWDALGDAITRTWRATKNLIGETIALKVINSNEAQSLQALIGWYRTFTGSNEDLEKAISKGVVATKDMHTAQGLVVLTTTEQSNLERRLGEDFKETNKKRTDANKLIEDGRLKQLRWNDSIREATYRMGLNTSALYKYISAIPGAVSGTGQLDAKMLNLTSRSLGLEHVLVRQMPSAFGVMDRSMFSTGVAVRGLADKITSHLTQALQGIPQLFIDAFTGGGGVIGALKGIGVSLLNAIMKEILDPIMAAVARWAVNIARRIASAFSMGGVSLPNLGGLGGGAGAGAGAGGAGASGLTNTLGSGLLEFGAGALASLSPAAFARYLAERGGTLLADMSPAELQAIRDYQAAHPESVITSSTDPLTGAYIGPSDTGDRRRREEQNITIPAFAFGSHGVQDFGSGTLAMLHGREEVVPEGQRRAGGSDVAILARLDAIREAILHRAVVSVQVNKREIARANVEALNDGQFVTDFREVLGVT